MNKDEAKEKGCICYEQWPNFQPISDMITEICDNFVPDSYPDEGQCANCEHEEECHSE
jgi:hypothetical protein